ncbi:MAG TPA: class I SAM-dependent methyltransferase [Casimicrobiaceae bacterium]|nr:class I SAM-dependent methyltransferase [Casimicrobiaceae bacterium]
MPSIPVADMLRRARRKLNRRPQPLTRFIAEPWFVDSVETSQGALTVRGWAFLDGPAAADDVAGRFSVNGRPFDRVFYPLERVDVGQCFPARERAKDCGFVLVSNDAGVLYRGGVLEVTCRDRDTPAAAIARDSWFIPDASLHRDLPDEDRRFRVIGNRDAAGFLMSGCTDHERLDRACLVLTGKRLRDYRSILDWGCGCGRIARHLAPVAAGFHGCDIDGDNVAWCAEHLPGSYVASSLRPPLPYAQDTFDLIYGISIFTHFRPDLEALWLSELRRVAKPGALLLMTVHGQTTIDYARLDAAARGRLTAAVQRAGILFGGRNDQLDGYAAHEGQYVNVYHSQRYIRRIWAKYFEIVDILPGYLFTHDLAVMRRR